MAAETLHCSSAHYAAHLGGNIRVDKLMPDEVDTLEAAEFESWEDAGLAQALEIDVGGAPVWRESYRRTTAIVDAATPAEASRGGVRLFIRDVLAQGLTDEEDIESLVVQICYRPVDLAVLLDLPDMRLSDYS